MKLIILWGSLYWYYNIQAHITTHIWYFFIICGRLHWCNDIYTFDPWIAGKLFPDLKYSFSNFYHSIELVITTLMRHLPLLIVIQWSKNYQKVTLSVVQKGIKAGKWYVPFNNQRKINNAIIKERSTMPSSQKRVCREPQEQDHYAVGHASRGSNKEPTSCYN